jgi:hypothetical protein
MALTIQEAIEAPFNFELPENLVERTMINHSLDGLGTYASSDEKGVDLAVADLCSQLITLSSESEGGLSMTYDVNRLNRLRSTILRKWDMENENYSIGGVNSRSVW